MNLPYTGTTSCALCCDDYLEDLVVFISAENRFRRCHP
jgi:hypothetical protein